jgi:tungstate transport system ATP-binding protein
MSMRHQASILPLTITNLGFDAGSKTLLKDISFRLPKSGISAIIGPNGAGKSLLLRLMHGMMMPTHGQVTWNRAEGEIAGRKRHAMLFQNPVMLRRSVRANIRHALQAVGATDVATLTAAALERFGLTALAEQPARLLSGGEKQRVAIARAWVLEPELLFLDEPTSQLDPGATRQIEEIILGLAKDGMTVLMATHDLGQTKRLSQRILFMHQGRLLADANTSEFFNQPPTEQCRAFLAGELLW